MTRMELHPLLRRKLRRYAGQQDLLSAHGDWIRTIDETFREFDDDRRFRDHSMDVMSAELCQRNASLVADVAQKEKREQLLEQRESELRRSNEFQNKLIEGISAGILVLDGSGTIRFANGKAYKMLGLVEPAAPDSATSLVDTRFRWRLVRNFRAAVVHGRNVTVEAERTLLDNTVRYMRLTMARISLPGEAPEVVVVVEDVTERRTMRLQLNQAAKMALLGEMAAGVAHEINQPLTVIRLAAEMLTDPECPPDPDFARDRGERILEMTTRAMEIIRQLRLFARGADARVAPFSINDAIVDSLSLLHEKLRLRSIDLVVTLDPQAGTMLGTANQLGQVFINLVNNSVDALAQSPSDPGRTKRIEVRTRRISPARVEATVRDNGPGIPPEIRDRIFDPFFTTKAPGSGTGLGLSISFGIIEAHGGQIAALAASNGAAFRIVLPSEAESVSMTSTSAVNESAAAGGLV